VLTTVKREQLARENKTLGDARGQQMSPADSRQVRARRIAVLFDARLWDDGILDPGHTRNMLALALSAQLQRALPRPKFGVFRM